MKKCLTILFSAACLLSACTSNNSTSNNSSSAKPQTSSSSSVVLETVISSSELDVMAKKLLEQNSEENFVLPSKCWNTTTTVNNIKYENVPSAINELLSSKTSLAYDMENGYFYMAADVSASNDSGDTIMNNVAYCYLEGKKMIYAESAYGKNYYFEQEFATLEEAHAYVNEGILGMVSEEFYSYLSGTDTLEAIISGVEMDTSEEMKNENKILEMNISATSSNENSFKAEIVANGTYNFTEDNYNVEQVQSAKVECEFADGIQLYSLRENNVTETYDDGTGNLMKTSIENNVEILNKYEFEYLYPNLSEFTRVEPSL